MFDIAWTELLVVAVIAVLVVGPKELPGMLRAFGKTFGQLRRTAREFQSTFNDALREAERDANLDEIKKGLGDVKKFNPASDLSNALKETQTEINRAATAPSSPKATSDVTPSEDAMDTPAEATKEVIEPKPSPVADPPAAPPTPTGMTGAAPVAPSVQDKAPAKAAADGR